jgi:hypothetical protein
MEMIYSRELGLKDLQDTEESSGNQCGLSDVPALYHRIKGTGKNQFFCDVSVRSERYLTECLGHENIRLRNF